MDDDNPLPCSLPAAPLKQAQCRVSWLQAVNDRFEAMGIKARQIANFRKTTPCGSSRWRP